jgi:hypothetical protein
LNLLLEQSISLYRSVEDSLQTPTTLTMNQTIRGIINTVCKSDDGSRRFNFRGSGQCSFKAILLNEGTSRLVPQSRKVVCAIMNLLKSQHLPSKMSPSYKRNYLDTQIHQNSSTCNYLTKTNLEDQKQRHFLFPLLFSPRPRHHTSSCCPY